MQIKFVKIATYICFLKINHYICTMNRIDEILKEQGRRRKWLAEKISVSEAMIGYYCRNESQPTTFNLCIIAEALQVSINDLIKPTSSV